MENDSNFKLERLNERKFIVKSERFDDNNEQIFWDESYIT